MYPSEPLRVCEKCDIRHYDNCPDCYGFGVYWSAEPGVGQVPVRAAWASDGLTPFGAYACPTCHSTAAGMPAIREAGR